MNLDQFTVFAAVAKHRNVTRASEELHISQPAVTKHLRLLQESYNSDFYKRRGRGIELTEAGRIFFRNARRILKLHERLKEKLHAVSSRDQPGSVKIGASSSPATSLVPSLLARFEKRYPHIDIDLRTDNKVALERMILNGEVDVALINNPPSNHSLALERYRREPVVTFVSRNHPLAKRKKRTWQDLERVPFIIRKRLGGRSTAERFLQLLRKKGLKPKVALRCDSPEAIKAAVKRNMGMGLLFREIIEPEVKSGELTIIKLPEGNFDGQSFIVYRKSTPLPPNAQKFLALLRKERPH
jgi:DNA-binding transcriptional LysR family regulator